MVEALTFDVVGAPVFLAGAVGVFFLFLLLGLLALPITAFLDRLLGKEKALLLYALGLLLLAVFVLRPAAPPASTPRARIVSEFLPLDPLDVSGSPQERPALLGAESARGEGARRNVFRRFTDTRPLPPPVLDVPPWLPLEFMLPPPVPGPRPSARHLLRGERLTVTGSDSGAAVPPIPEATFTGYAATPSDVYDWVQQAGQPFYVYILALNAGAEWVREGEPGFDELKFLLARQEEGWKDLQVRYTAVGGEKATAARLDPVEVVKARQQNSTVGRGGDHARWYLRRTVDNLFMEALARSGLRANYAEPPIHVDALLRAAEQMAEVGQQGKEQGEGWRRAAALLEVALPEVSRQGIPEARNRVLLRLIEAYRALQDERRILGLLSQFVRANPRNPDGWVWLGEVVLDRLGDAAAALIYFDEALDLDRSHGAALIGRGRSLAWLGQTEKALSTFESAGSDTQAQKGRALALLRLGALDRARTAVDGLLARAASDPFALLLKGCLLYTQGQDVKGARDLFLSVAQDPQAEELRAQAAWGLGIASLRLGEGAAAASAFQAMERALALGSIQAPIPDEALSPALGRALLAWAAKSADELSAALEEARREAPGNSYLEAFAAMVAFEEDDHAAARRALERAQTLAPDYGELDGWFARSSLALGLATVEIGGDPNEARRDFERAVAYAQRAADRESARDKLAFRARVREALVRLAATHLPRRQRYGGALAAVEKVLQKGDALREQPAALAVRGYCHFELDDVDQCMRDLQHVLDVVPETEGNEWLPWRVWAAARLDEVKRWREMEEKIVTFEGLSLSRDWSNKEAHGVRVTLEGGTLHFHGEADRDGNLDTPTVEAFNETLFDKRSLETITLRLRIPSQEAGGYQNNNIFGVQILTSVTGSRGGKTTGIGLFNDKGRVAIRVGGGRDKTFKDGEVHRLRGEGDVEVPWPEGEWVEVQVVRDPQEESHLSLRLNGEEVFSDQLSWLRRSRGKLALWIGGYANAAQPFDVHVDGLRIIRRNEG